MCMRHSRTGHASCFTLNVLETSVTHKASCQHVSHQVSLATSALSPSRDGKHVRASESLSSVRLQHLRQIPPSPPHHAQLSRMDSPLNPPHHAFFFLSEPPASLAGKSSSSSLSSGSDIFDIFSSTTFCTLLLPAAVSCIPSSFL